MRGVFSRPVKPEWDDLFHGCEDLALTFGPNDSAVGWNLLYEHRLSDLSINEWLTANGDPRLAQEILNSLVLHDEHLRAHPRATYLSQANEHNIRHPGNGCCVGGGQSLAHVLDLTNRFAREVWGHGKDELGLGWLDLAALPASFLRVGDERTMTSFLRSLASFSEAGNRLPPTWVAEWADWQSRIDPAIPESWAGAVGLSKPPSAVLAVFKYSVQRTGRILIRPTQLEAGAFGRHFPSPECAAPDLGGRVIDANGLATHSPVEFLHEPFVWDIDDWTHSELPLGYLSTSVGPAAQLFMDRDRHWQEPLQREFGREPIVAWMAAPNPH